MSGADAVGWEALSAEEPFRMMGIVNVTPDSFSDGGRYLDSGAAIEHGRSSRPRAPRSSTSAESRRGPARRRSARTRRCVAWCR